MSIFRFKQFEVDQIGCAMKINTDGVLVGAMAQHSSPKNILDIGTGTGVIALMLAQRFPNANVEAVEIDDQAAETARKNFDNSIFADRLTIENIAFEQYDSNKKFDLIVSNPPFFVNDLKSEEIRKGIARHATENFFEMLIKKSNDILNDSGKLWFILPIKQANEVIKFASTYKLELSERIHIHSDLNKPTFRQMICLSRQKENLLERDFYLYESFQNHAQEYKMLLKEFFLAF
ncbi:tRNA1(Val) (adenine(37)-N6)-methyltransferase [Pedobacter mucosus]|uniref:tRNA1(Val) (adenine(37)-N6)-methyltransferase n=1 Tax=Pedobacter mucosus TaxID=2895286 RepID=UPI001EE47D97|nr:methyltransferase [Pedobacter mucosus]UKT62166.1 methyltransferase [Pedobacter mucosus]